MGFKNWFERKPKEPSEHEKNLEVEGELGERTMKGLPAIFDAEWVELSLVKRRIGLGKESPYKNIPYREVGEKIYRRIKSEADGCGLMVQVPGVEAGFWRKETREFIPLVAQSLREHFESDEIIGGDEALLQKLQPVDDMMRDWQDKHGIKRIEEINIAQDFQIHETDWTVPVSKMEFEQRKDEYGIQEKTERIILEYTRLGYEIPNPNGETYVQRARVIALTPEP